MERLCFLYRYQLLSQKNTVIFCAEPTFQLSEAHRTKKYEQTYRQTDRTLRVPLAALILENFFSHVTALFVDQVTYGYKIRKVDLTKRHNRKP